MSGSSSFDDQIERLRAMLGEPDVWEEQGCPETEHRLILVPQPEPLRDADIFSDLDDDEKIISIDHMIGGRLRELDDPSEVSNEPVDLPRYDLRVGEEVSAGEAFCPLLALTNFPNNYITTAYRKRVSRDFFDKGQIYGRIWDFFYIYPPPFISQKAILLLPSRQVENFLLTINMNLKTRLALPKDAVEAGFLVDFPEDGTPRPRYLGRSDEREMAEVLKQAVPSRTYKPDGEPELTVDPTDKSLEAFKRKMELLTQNDKKKKAAAKEKRKAERLQKQQSWNHIVKRVQRYLGIREVYRGHHEATKTTGESSLDSDLEWPVYDEAAEMTAAKTANNMVLNIEKPLPFETEDSVIFICVDVEAWERNHSLITEIGIATLDTTDITSLAPGTGGANWAAVIRARHFRIKEYSHLENTDFVGGCPDRFQFGTSEWISIKDAAREVSKCFEYPYSGKAAKSGDSSLPTNLNRKIVLVGHDVAADIKYLRELGYNPYTCNPHELIDTSFMYRAFRRESQPRNLGSVLLDLGIAGWDLHNAGNDAMYTLQAMVGIALRAKLEKQDKTSWEQEKKARVEETVKDALNNALDAQQGWSSGGEDSDGGRPETPIPPISPERKKNHKGRPTRVI